MKPFGLPPPPSHSAPKTFTCANCRREFDQGWPQEAALAEARANFPEELARDGIEGMGELCGGCHSRFLAWLERLTAEQKQRLQQGLPI